MSLSGTPDFLSEYSLFFSVQDNQKNTVMTSFTIIDKLTGPYSFSRTNKDSLNDKSDLYFLDFSWVPLFMQVSQVRSVNRS